MHWTAGYGAARECLGADRDIVGEAKRAAERVGFAEAYEPLERDFQPFAASRPRFASDLVEARMLQSNALYQSGDEVVLPVSAKRWLTAAELDGSQWSSSLSIDFHRSSDDYELSARNDGGASLVVLPLSYSSCWQASWQGGAGDLVPVDATWLGLLLRGQVSLRLRLPPETPEASCSREDGVWRLISGLLRSNSGKIMGGRYTLGDPIDFAAGGASDLYATQGWSYPKSWGRWSLGADARLVLRLVPPPSGDLLLEASVGALLGAGRQLARATVSVNGAALGTWEFRPGDTPGRRRVIVPRQLLADTGVLVADFKFDDPVSPKELGMSDDKRPLALSFQSLTVRAADGETP